jgi:hypothetical protein
MSIFIGDCFFLVVAVNVVYGCLRYLLLMLRVGNVCPRLSVYADKLRMFAGILTYRNQSFLISQADQELHL